MAMPIDPRPRTETSIVNREAFHEVPPRVEYSETKLGATLNAALGPPADWGDRHAKRVETARKQAEASK